MAFHAALDWHPGEEKAHKLTGVDRMVGDNPTSPFLTPRAAYMVQRYPLLALGTLDDQDRPWVTVWGGEAGFAQQVARSVLGVRTLVDTVYDPVVRALFRGKTDGEILRQEGAGKLAAGLSILLEERGRVKIMGRVVGGACSRHEGDEEGTEGKENGDGAGEIQLALKIEQSLGNCPKYLNRKTLKPAVPHPKLLAEGPKLGTAAKQLIENADLFFVASAHEHEDMDANHRGGPQGFIRVHDTDEASEIIWPEYSGNNLYQTLGNLMTTPKAGLCIPNFETGDVLYVTGTAEVLIGKAASDVLAKTKLAVRLHITDSLLVAQGLPFRGTNMPDPQQGRSPYNPRIRHLLSEQADEFASIPGTSAPVTASLIKKTKVTPTINRYRFSLSDPLAYGPWQPGQYVALDFSEELDMGYSHMRDDDPGSLNDDFMRTFTVSSIPQTLGAHGEEFEITVREVGSATRWLSWQREGRVEVGVRGFGGEFRFDMHDGKNVGFIAAGIGITPLLGQMGELDLARVHVLWSVGVKDVALVADIVKQYPQLKSQLEVFLTGDEKTLDDDVERKVLAELLQEDSGVKIQRRRLRKDDLVALEGRVDDWYLCTAPAMRQIIQSWLPEKSFVFENFDY
ncbi:MAG: pyridoxamine 5'-phosphate oxidase family protein [Terriglobus roseus]|nr:pyridoxamine 5'-phosphate oxidase family protein [Terriglobus roseus]